MDLLSRCFHQIHWIKIFDTEVIPDNLLEFMNLVGDDLFHRENGI